MGATYLLTHSRVYKFDGLVSRGAVFKYDDEIWAPELLFLDTERFNEMGQPTEIVVTITPGNLEPDEDDE